MVLFLGGLWGPMFQLDHMKATVQNLRPHNGGGHQLHGQLQHLAAPGAFISVTSKSAESKTATATCRPVGMATSSNHRMPSIRVCGVGRPGGQWGEAQWKGWKGGVAGGGKKRILCFRESCVLSICQCTCTIISLSPSPSKYFSVVGFTPTNGFLVTHILLLPFWAHYVLLWSACILPHMEWVTDYALYVWHR